jgi:hypothetical protein
MVEIIEVITNQKFVFRAYDENGTFTNTFDLRPTGTRTLVTFQHDFPKMIGIGVFLVPLLVPIVGRRDAKLRLSMLKERAESR